MITSSNEERQERKENSQLHLFSFILSFSVVLFICLGINQNVYAASAHLIFINGLTGDSNDAEDEYYLYNSSLFSNALKGYYINGIKISNYIYRDKPTTDEMKRVISNVASSSKDDDVTLFYYSGHGISAGITTGNGFFQYDGENGLYNSLNKIKGKIFLILDCCYSGAILTSDFIKIDTNKFIVLTACDDSTPSKTYNATYFSAIMTGAKNSVHVSRFFQYIDKALGFNIGFSFDTKKLAADGIIDGKKDGLVTENELYQFLYRNYSKKVTGFDKKKVMVHPQKSGNAKFCFSKTKPTKALLASVGINTSTYNSGKNSNSSSRSASISLNTKSKTIYKNGSFKIKATVKGSSNNVSWKSSDKSIATVKNGNVTGKKAGTTYIYAKANGKTAKCKVTVKNPSIKLSKSSADIYVNASVTLKATVTGSSKEVTWSTSDKKIATVNKDGKVTGKKAGTATITAKANGVSAKCKVRVTPKKTTTTPTTSDTYKTFSENAPITIGKTKFSMAYDSSAEKYTIYETTNGTKKILIKNNSGYVAVTNGSVIYYAVGNGWNSSYSIYKYTISNGSESFITSGLRYEPIACDGNYLYYGTAWQYGGVVGPMQVMDLKTKKSISTNRDVDNLVPVNGKLLASCTGKPHGGPLFLMNKDGSGIKMLTDQSVSQYKIEGNYIYFMEITHSWDQRVSRCDLNGNNKKVLEDWKPAGSGSSKYF